MMETLPNFLEETFIKTADIFQLIEPTKIVFVYSTPIVGLYDLEAVWSHTSRGKFRGFKLHAVINQLGLALRAIVTPGNRYDTPFLPGIIGDLETDYVLADAGYDSKANASAVKAINAEPVIASNPKEENAKKSSIISF